MTIKDMLVLLDNGPRVAADPAAAARLGPAATAALDLAARIGAHVTAIALAVDPIVPGFVVAPLPVEVIEQARTQAIAVAQDSIAAFEAEATRLGVAHETRISEILMGGVPEGFAAAARTTDLVVIGQDDPDHPEPMREAMVETALFEGAAPTLIVPYISKGAISFKRIMIGWDGGRTAARAVHSALPILHMAEKITVTMVDRAGADPGQPGADLATWLARHALDVDVAQIEAPDIAVADALLDQAADQSYDVLVMGGYGHSRVREFLLGGATRGILASMTLPVLMAH